MKIWQRRVIGLLTLGGSSVGLAAIALETPNSQLQGLTLVIIVLFAIVFLYGIAIGVLIIENDDKSMQLALPFWLAQLPVFQSAWISYGLYTGAKFDILLQSDFNIKFELFGGARFTFYLFPGDSTAFGVNVVAVYISYLIWKNRRRVA